MIRFEFGECGTRRVLTMSNGELVIRPLQANEKYVAISHTWGDITNTIEGIGWTVGSWISLETCKALVEIYDKVWIDSLCIKQEPKGEPDKAAQIKNMHNIFADAIDVVVVFTGNYSEQVNALRRLTQLFENLKLVLIESECTSLPDCPYVESFLEVREAAIIVRKMPWFRRVWTLQEAIIPKSLSFVGIEGGKMKCNVISKKDFHNLIQAYELLDASVPVEGMFHFCTRSIINIDHIWADVSGIVESMRPVTQQWFKYMKGQDRIRSLENTAGTVFLQLGRNNRDCKFMNDRVYAVCALLDIEMDSVDYYRQFNMVFFEAVKKLVKLGICGLPLRPQVAHGETWLPNLEHVDLKNAWETIEARGSRGERRSDLYHNIVCEGDFVYAMGELIQICHPYKLICTSMESVEKTLLAIVEAEGDRKNFNVCSIPDPALRTFMCIWLWMFTERGGDTSVDGVMPRTVESLIFLVYNRSESHMKDELLLDTSISNILDEIWTSVSTSIKVKLDEEKWTIWQVVTWMLEETFLVIDSRSVFRGVPKDTSEDDASAFRRTEVCKRDAVLVAKENFGLVLYSLPSSAYETRQTFISYGLFYNPQEREDIPAQLGCGNILVENEDGIWDNHGMGQFWYIADVTQTIEERRVRVGTLH